MIRGDQRIAQSHVDPLRANRRHRMGSIAEQQHSRGAPGRASRHLHVEEERARGLLAVTTDVLAEVRCHQVGDGIQPRLGRLRASRAVGALRDEPAEAQPSVPGGVRAGRLGRSRAGEGIEDGRVSKPRWQRQAPPDDVVSQGLRLERDGCPLPHHRASSVGADQQVRTEFTWPCASVCANHHAPVRLRREVPHRRPRLEAKRGEALRLLDECAQQMRLRHDPHAVRAFSIGLGLHQKRNPVEVELPAIEPP